MSRQAAIVKDSLTTAATLARAAAAVLLKPNSATSEGVQTWLGDSTSDDLDAE